MIDIYLTRKNLSVNRHEQSCKLNTYKFSELDHATNEHLDVEMCANQLTDDPNCRNTFYFSPATGWCLCEKYGSHCSRQPSYTYNEYRLRSSKCA